MDLSNPLRAIAPTLDADALAVLARTESALTLAAIVRLAGRGSRMGLHDAVRRLVAQGVVEEVPAGQAPMYRLAREHVLADAILACARAAGDVRSRLADAVGRLGDEVVHASIFGSFARGEADAASDIDLLVIVRDDVDVSGEAWLAHSEDLGRQVEIWTGNSLECVSLTATDARRLAAAEEPVVESWRRDGDLLSGAPLEAVLDAEGGGR